MGILLSDNGKIIIRPYLTTKTFANLRASGAAVVNLVSDVWLFYKTALKRYIYGGKLPPDMFEGARVVKAPRLRGADGFIEVKVEGTSVEDNRARFVCRIAYVELRSADARTYLRANYAVLESLICFTKIEHFVSTRDLANAEAQLRLIEHYKEVTEKVAPSTKYTEIVRHVLELSRRLVGRHEGVC
jgi:hypothetical protein